MRKTGASTSYFTKGIILPSDLTSNRTAAFFLPILLLVGLITYGAVGESSVLADTLFRNAATIDLPTQETEILTPDTDDKRPTVGPLTNGANHTGTIPTGGVTDTWTFQANTNDYVSITLGEVLPPGPDPNFRPRLRLLRPDGSQADDTSDGFLVTDIALRVNATGVFTVLVSNFSPGSQTGPANYIITYTKTPGPYTVSAGDEGGQLINGANHTGTIALADQDTWTFDANFNEYISLSMGELLVPGPDPMFRPQLRLIRPDGVVSDDTSDGFQATDISLRAPVTGVYTVLVSNFSPNSQTTSINYFLTLAKTPGPYSVSPGDDGGQLTNGANHIGGIGVGDQDTWTFDATFNDYISLSLGEILVPGPDPAFRPHLRLVRPDGVVSDDSSDGFQATDIALRAPITGTYTVLVSNFSPNSQVGNVNYFITLSKSPGPYTVSPGDDGGQLTNGANHNGTISVGDQDTWTFDASFNDYISLSLGEILISGPDPAFRPQLRLIRPDGAVSDDTSDGFQATDIALRAPIAGVYTVLVTNFTPNSQIGSVNYFLTLTKTPGPYSVSAGDEGGSLTNGANHTGGIGVGDQDTWTFDAAFNDDITLSLGEVLVSGPDTGFRPQLRLIRPDGVVSGDTSDGFQATEISLRAPVSGTYTVLVSNFVPNSQVGVVNYFLTLAKTPGPYVISPSDHGGPLTENSTRPGTLYIGDQDVWIFHATANNNIVLNLSEVTVPGPDLGFSPRLRIIGPGGVELFDSSGTNLVEASRVIPLTGVYTVIVSNNVPNSQVGNVNYTLAFTGPTQPTLSIGNLTQNEGDSGTTNFTFAVGLSTPVTQAVGFTFATSDGSATAGSDYLLVPETQATITPGNLTQSVTIAVNGDITIEPNETFLVSLSNVLVVNVSVPTGTGTIVNDDFPGTIQFSAATYGVAESGGTAVITATRTAGRSNTVSAQYTSNNGSAVSGEDYTATSGTLTWAEGDTTAKTFSIPITNDEIFEGDETVNISLGNPTGGASLGTPSGAVLTILDNKSQPSISILAIARGEGNSGTTPFTFTISLDRLSVQTVTVNASTSNGTATAPDDYIAAGPTLVTFNPGESSKTFTVLVNGDTTIEPNENFFVNLTAASNATILSSPAVGTINDDDNVSFVSVSGRVTTPAGQGLRNAVVSMTDSLGARRTATTSSFGIYTFENVRSAEEYTFAVSSKRYRFTPRILTVGGNISNLDFVGLE